MRQTMISALRVALIYAVAAAVWIAVSDRIVDAMFDNPRLLTLAQTWKGWFFVAVTSLLLYALVVREVAVQAAARRRADQAAQELAVSEQRYRRLFEDSGEGIFVTDSDARILSVNRAFTEMTGYSREEAVGSMTTLLKSGRHGAEFYAAMWADIAATGRWRGEIWNRRKNGEVYPQWLSITAVKSAVDDSVAHYIAFLSDLSEQKTYEERIHRLSYHDLLTNLPNRALLLDRIGHGIAAARRDGKHAALLFLDLDRFKDVNDSLGRTVGDALLREIAGRLVGAVRAEDTVARVGPDLFVAFLPHLDAGAEAAVVARKLLAQVAEPLALGEHALRMTACVGAAVFPDDGGDAEVLMQHADAALHHAMAAGRDRFEFFAPEFNAAAKERLALENELRVAVDAQQFELHYQPQLQLADGRVFGVEALLRWRHPQHGLVPPGRFIPLAEDSGLIVPIGTWVLEEACRQGRAWLDAGLPPLTMAVNVSVLQFLQPDFTALVARTLAATGLPPCQLELEVTESIIMEESQYVVATLHELRALGVQLAIDDFGTGYSSLSYLRRLAVGRLKVDQSFVRGSVDSCDDAAITAAIIGMAHSLRLRVIAEGVETPAQADFLRAQGCEEAQGFLFSKPLPAAAATAFLTAGGSCLNEVSERS